MNTRHVEQNLHEAITQLNALQQLHIEKTASLDASKRQTETTINLEIPELDIHALEIQLKAIDLENGQVIKFNDRLAELLGLNESETLAWRQASTAQYDQTTTAYILNARNFASNYIPLSSYVGTAVRYIAGKNIAGAEISPIRTMEKINEVVRQQKIVEAVKSKYLREIQDIHLIESEIASLQRKIKQLETEINHHKEEEQRMATLANEQKQSEAKDTKAVELPPSKASEESRTGIPSSQKATIQEHETKQQVKQTQFSEEAIIRISLLEQNETVRKQEPAEDEHRVNAGLGGLIGFAAGMIAGGVAGFALAVPTLGFSILLGPLFGAIGGVILGVKIGYAISERLSTHNTSTTNQNDTPSTTITGTTTHAKLAPTLQADKKNDAQQNNITESVKHTQIIKPNKESKSESVVDISNNAKPSLR